MDELQQELFKLQDLKYRNFHSKLMPGLIRRQSSGSAHRYCGNLRKNLQKRKQQKLF